MGWPPVAATLRTTFDPAATGSADGSVTMTGGAGSTRTAASRLVTEPKELAMTTR